VAGANHSVVATFDLGDAVVRGLLNVDPFTTRIGTASAPIPAWHPLTPADERGVVGRWAETGEHLIVRARLAVGRRAAAAVASRISRRNFRCLHLFRFHRRATRNGVAFPVSSRELDGEEGSARADAPDGAPGGRGREAGGETKLTAAVPASDSRRSGQSTRPRLALAARVDATDARASAEVELSSPRALAAFALALAMVVVCGLLGLLLATTIFGYGGLG
jgi:hypothetical protein